MLLAMRAGALSAPMCFMLVIG